MSIVNEVDIAATIRNKRPEITLEAAEWLLATHRNHFSKREAIIQTGV